MFAAQVTRRSGREMKRRHGTAATRQVRAAFRDRMNDKVFLLFMSLQKATILTAYCRAHMRDMGFLRAFIYAISFWIYGRGRIAGYR